MWSLFLLSSLLFSTRILAENATARVDILLILERQKLIQVSEEKSSAEISFELCFEWETKRAKLPKSRELAAWSELDDFGIITENLQSFQSARSVVTRENSVQNVRSSRSVVLQSEKPLDFSAFPNDVHLFQLRYTSVAKNSSQLTLNPHFVVSAPEQSHSQWQFEIEKAFVQWVVHKNESFEQAVFEFRISRRPPPSLRVSLFLTFLINMAMIFAYFPISGMYQKTTSSGFFLCCGFLIAIASTGQVPKSGTITSFDYQLLSLLLLGFLIEIFHQMLPFLIFHLRCCPIEAEPSPPKFPSPSDQFSLDTERSKCNAALDSARAESAKSPRVANFDMCLAEVKYTMSVLNEVLNMHSSAEWRRKLWCNAYRRFEMLAFVILQLINFILFSSFCQ
ncbi:unnamed protein product [Caenorhabditis sp. 36 PRJEB53466]|nr:unnamed protein product [Caenorhabditis sp. 36 PRJEB53466]